MVADQKNSEAYEFIEEISEKGLDLSYQIFVREKFQDRFYFSGNLHMPQSPDPCFHDGMNNNTVQTNRGNQINDTDRNHRQRRVRKGDGASVNEEEKTKFHGCASSIRANMDIADHLA